MLRTWASLRWRSCGRKKFFNTKEDANHTALYRTKVAGIKIHMYPCPVCHGWHLTKQTTIFPPFEIKP